MQTVHGTEGHMAVYGPVCHPPNIIKSEAKLRAMNYLLYYTQLTKTTPIRTQLDALNGHF
jgi:hypothetical protein